MTTLASSSDYKKKHSPLKKLKTKNQVILPQMAMVCDKYILIGGAGAVAATAALKYVEL